VVKLAAMGSGLALAILLATCHEGDQRGIRLGRHDIVGTWKDQDEQLHDFSMDDRYSGPFAGRSWYRQSKNVISIHHGDEETYGPGETPETLQTRFDEPCVVITWRDANGLLQDSRLCRVTP
jgi:hypothetical protein